MCEDAQKNSKRVHRLFPCPAHDIEATESWLSDMAAQGFVLMHDGISFGFAIFEKVEPCTIRYRLEPAHKNDENGNPSDKTIELRAYYGWQYVATRGRYHIYSADKADTQELNTDPKIQALAFEYLRKRQRTNMIHAFLLIIFSIISPTLLLHDKPLLYPLLLAVNIGTWFMMCALLVLWSSWSIILKGIHLRKLHKKLASGKDLNHKKNWQSNAVWYRLSKITFMVLFVVLIGLELHSCSNDIMNINVKSLEDYTDGFPFATIADLASDGIYTPDDDSYSDNTFELRSNWLAPKIIELHEDATVQLEYGKYLSGVLRVDYYETAAPWIAQEIAREYLAKEKRSENFEKYDLKDLGIDYSIAYLYLESFPTVIMQEGGIVMHVRFYQTSSTYEMPLDEWAQVFADSIESGT